MESLNKYYPNTKRRFIFGCLRNKDYKKMVSLIAQNCNIIYFYHFNHQNSCTFDELKSVCPVDCYELKSKDSINFDDGYLNIICGSFYMISELTQLLDISYYLD